MSGRVLNFSEFFDKYSTGSSAEVSLDDMTQSSSNFEVGFDETTYDQNQIGPNRPVASGTEMTPPAPGEGSPIATKKDAEMEAPTEEDLTDIEPEGEAEEASAETPEPEANEAFNIVGFEQFVNESMFSEDEYMEDPYGEMEDPFKEKEDPYAEDYDDATCTNCGEEIWYSEQGASCGCNM